MTAAALTEYLRSDPECEDLMECVYGLKQLDRDIFELLARSNDPLSVDDIAARVDRERSTAYRSLQRLRDAGFVTQDQVNSDAGGYHYVYTPIDPDAIATEMQRRIDEWADQMAALTTEFREKYGGPHPPPNRVTP